MSEQWILHGEALAKLKLMQANVFDSMVTDPPAGIDFMGKDWDQFRRTHNPNDVGRDNVFGRASRTSPSSASESDGEAFIAAMTPIFAEALRVLKPGAPGAVWAIPRTSHWTATALEAAGFEIRDRIHNFLGADGPTEAFLQSLDSAQLDALNRLMEGLEPSVFHALFLNGMPKFQNAQRQIDMSICKLPGEHCDKNLPANPAPEDHLCPASPEGEFRAGWATALAPAVEHWILVRKPLEGTQAKNQLRWGTGALNIDASRVERGNWVKHLTLHHAFGCQEGACVLGCPSRLLDEQSGVLKSGKDNVKKRSSKNREGNTSSTFGAENRPEGTVTVAYGDSGGASRMFHTFRQDLGYFPKASKSEKSAGLEGRIEAAQQDTGRAVESLGGNNPRNRGAKPRLNHHPTVKPIDLMRHLIRLTTPPGGAVLDMFAGSGTTLVSAYLEGVSAVGIEKEAPYVEIIKARLEHIRETGSDDVQ